MTDNHEDNGLYEDDLPTGYQYVPEGSGWWGLLVRSDDDCAVSNIA